MTYEEKLAFVKEHLGETVQFSDDKDFSSPDICLLGGIKAHGDFMDEEGCGWLYCRPIPEKKIIPWTLETAESVQLRRKDSGTKIWMNYGIDGAWYHGTVHVEKIIYEQLLGQFETVDGRPCGTEVME